MYHKSTQKVAIFDIDGTIFRSSLLIELVDRLVEDGIFPKTATAEFAREKLAWLDRKGDYESYILAVIGVFMRHIKGVSYKDFDRVGEEVVAAQEKRVYRFTRDLVKKLKKQKYFLLAISQSPKTILDKFCKRWGFDKVYGRIYELGPQDRFTGLVTDEHLISNKGAILRRAVEKENLTLAGSVGVGDTEGDVAFLELVERPICFNPNAKLYAQARRNKWEVVVERKDVVYKIQ